MPGTRMQPRPGNTKKPGSAIGRLMWLDVRPDGAVTFRQNCFRRSFACASRPRTEIAIHPVNRFFQRVSKSLGHRESSSADCQAPPQPELWTRKLPSELPQKRASDLSGMIFSRPIGLKLPWGLRKQQAGIGSIAFRLVGSAQGFLVPQSGKFRWRNAKENPRRLQ